MKNYEKLLALLKEYKKTEFWKKLTGDDFFRIEPLGNVYVSVLGYHGGDLGLVVYKDLNDLRAQLDVSYGEFINFPDTYLRMSCYELCIDSVGGLLQEEDKKVLRKNKIKSKHGIFRLNPGQKPRIVDEEEAMFLIQVLNHVLEIIDYFKDVPFVLELEVDLKKVLVFDKKDGKWKHSYKKMPNHAKELTISSCLDDKSLNKLLLFHNKGAIAIGWFYFPFYTEDAKSFPQFYIIMDLKTHIIYGMGVLKEEEIPELQNKILQDLAKVKLRPETIAFTSFEPEVLCRDLIKELNAKIYIDTDLTPMFQIYEEIAGGFSKGR